jgi:CRP-like cAMP-binding protein
MVDRVRLPVPIHLIRKLEKFTHLAPEEKEALEAVAALKVRRFAAREDIVREGDKPDHVNLFLDGWACRYKTLEDGRRQIIAYFIPGDLCDLNVSLLSEMDHSIGPLTAVSVAEISHEALEAITATYARIGKALAWESLVNIAIQREWTVSLGRRTALERVSHLLCELFIRLGTVGRTSGFSCDFPITQADLGDTLGLSTVHVNRTLQEMRAMGLITLRGKELLIPDFNALKRVAMFNETYLHLGHEGRHLDANV